MDTDRKLNVLLVEDDFSDVICFKRELEGYCENVYMVENIAEAIEYLDKNYKKVDLIILDIRLPDKGGDNGDCFREFEKFGIPLLLTSGAPDHKYGREAGRKCRNICGYLNKNSSTEDKLMQINIAAGRGERVRSFKEGARKITDILPSTIKLSGA